MLAHDMAILNSPNVGGVAQMVERSLSMREVRGSMPLSSIILFLFLLEKRSFCQSDTHFSIDHNSYSAFLSKSRRNPIQKTHFRV